MMKKKPTKRPNITKAFRCQVNYVDIENQEEEPIFDDFHPHCAQKGCYKYIFSACHKCLSMLCFDHFLDLSDCSMHNENPIFFC